MAYLTSGLLRWVSRGLLCFLLIVIGLMRRLWALVSVYVLRSTGSSCSNHTGRKPVALKKMTLVVSQPQLTSTETSAVVELLCWCLNMGLEYIFMFDPNGVLKEKSDAIVHRVREECPELCVTGTSGWTPIEKQTMSAEKQKGTQVVHFLSRGDSLSPLLQAASYPEIQENKRQGYRGLDDVDQYWSTDLSMEMLRNEMAAVFGEAAVLEPDIICVTGPVFSLAFCPPWHSRFSEIYYLGPLNTLRFSQFSATLGRFWQTQQRFGV